MKKGRKWLRMLMPVMALTFLGFAQSSFAQNDYPDNNNSDNYDNNSDNSDEALIQPEQEVNYNTFHDELSPYGSWRDYPGYGNVWVCNVAGFRPYYSGGHWAYTRFGWTWVSDYSWGWAPFHYGRWAFDNAYGWFWVPGYTWGPAWVSWRTGGDYYGWAPLSPGLSVGVNVGIGIGAASWVFLPHRYMGYRSINPYYVNRQQNVTIIRNTTIINNTNVYNNNRYIVGPDRRDVERYSGQRIQQQNIYVSNQRTGGRQDRNGIHMYSPNINRGNAVNNGRQDQRDNKILNHQNNAAQGNARQLPLGGQPSQNGVQQQNNGNDRTNRTQEMENRRQQEQQQQNNQRQQQIEQQRQQHTNDNREQMQQQMDQRRQQQQDAQHQQMMQQQQRQQMMQQRQQQFQQRQQQPQQQRNQDVNRPAQQSGKKRDA